MKTYRKLAWFVFGAIALLSVAGHSFSQNGGNVSPPAYTNQDAETDCVKFGREYRTKFFGYFNVNPYLPDQIEVRAVNSWTEGRYIVVQVGAFYPNSNKFRSRLCFADGKSVGYRQPY